MLTQVHPVLFHIGSILIPAYGAAAALGVLLALLLAQRTARVADVNAAQVWNLCVLALFAALIGQRLLLVLVNWSALRRHPSWMLGLAMIHHPLLAAVGALAGVGSAVLYARWQRMPLGATADALAAPLALGLAFEQLGALLAGSGYGTEAGVRWAVTYTSPLAARWSGTPLGIPLHPVQAYAALAFLTLSILLLVWLPARRQQGDGFGLWLLGTGVAIYTTEFWRDPQGRGAFLGDLLSGSLDGPQAAAVLFVLAGGAMLLERKDAGQEFRSPALSPERSEEIRRRACEEPRTEFEGPRAKCEGPRAKCEEPRAKCEEPRARNEAEDG
jgi:phosphatidylglycerol:prolipoprotein diacylglycerol transferase